MKLSLRLSVVRSLVAATLMVGAAAVSVGAANVAMPVAQQNAMVQKHCAVCHSDAARNGGLSLEHFDAAQAAPSLAAMMLSKLTSGVSLETVKAMGSDSSAAALVATKLKGGAINAAGIPIADWAAVEALTAALASEAIGATEWSLNRIQDPVTKASVTTASILRELPAPARGADDAAMHRSYRLVLACNAATHEGEMRLAWAPAPTRGILSVALDGQTPLIYTVAGTETMGNGSQGAPVGPASIGLYDSKTASRTPGMRLPVRTLTVSNLFPNETVEFPFDGVTPAVRQALSTCFTGSAAH